MKLWYLLLALFVVGALCEDEVDVDDDVHESEDDFEKEFHVLPAPGKAKEEDAENLKESEEQINEQNKKYKEGKGSFAEGLNPWSNMPADEFKHEKEGLNIPKNLDELKDESTDDTDDTDNRAKGLFLPSEEVMNNPVNRAKLVREYAELDRQAVPATYDANALGLVTKAKNQRNCGACAAFAANALHETCMLKAGAKKEDTDLSEQYLLDCGYNKDSMNGCDGATPHAYTEFFQKKGGVAPHEAQDLYLDRNPKLKCPKNLKFWNSGAYVSRSFFDYKCNADKLKKLVYKYGGVMVAIYASDKAFSNYKAGVFDKCSSNKSDHAVLVTGYGTDSKSGKDYWVIKNSWGESWGQKGFGKVERGNNACGIEEICVVAVCTAKGKAEKAPPTPKPKEPEEKAVCDISKLYNDPNIEGSFTMENYGPDGKAITSNVKCKKSKCRPQYPGARNACVYICGKDPCTAEI